MHVSNHNCALTFRSRLLAKMVKMAKVILPMGRTRKRWRTSVRSRTWKRRRTHLWPPPVCSHVTSEYRSVNNGVTWHSYWMMASRIRKTWNPKWVFYSVCTSVGAIPYKSLDSVHRVSEFEFTRHVSLMRTKITQTLCSTWWWNTLARV